MSFWERNMPLGMILRSNWSATQIADPHKSFTLEAYQQASGTSFSHPVPLHYFIDYGLWFQRQAIPDLDRSKILRVESARPGFLIHFANGETMRSNRVVVAAGIGLFTYRPAEFAHLPPSLVSHASEHRDLSEFAGKQVVSIGSGQSALETAALMHEAGAEVEVIGRAHKIQWLGGLRSRVLHQTSIFSKIFYAPTDVGPAGMSQLVARPELLQKFPRWLQDKMRKRAVRPAGARWLVSRLKDVPILLGRTVVSAAAVGGKVKLRLSDGSEKTVDHVILGTGYRVDVSKYDFLAPELLQSIRVVNGYPLLEAGLESSVPGLHFLGAPAARSFGPILQFVSGARYASNALLRKIAGKTKNQR
jgi:thioredoxin reductase